jgi:hypothetical protein
MNLLYEDGADVVELRIFGRASGRSRTYAGFFDEHDALATKAAEADGKGSDVYVTLNPCREACLGRADNDLVEIDPKRTPLASDTDIERRKWILVDYDPERPSKVSSTDGEKQAALGKAREAQDWLNTRGIKSILADSGNGAHLLVRVDLPNDSESRSLVERFLKALSFKFSDLKVKIDEGTFNAARLTKAYGVHARKGQNVERKGRIHRPSAILETPPAVTATGVDQLEAVAGELPEDPPRQKGPGRTGGAHLQTSTWLGGSRSTTCP